MILRKYKNSLLNTIKAHDLDPKLFSAEDGLIGTEDFTQIRLRNSPLRFAVSPWPPYFDRFGFRLSQWRQGYPISDLDYASNFVDLQVIFEQWLLTVVIPYLDEISAPDSWQILQDSVSHTMARPETPYEFEPFSEEEKVQLRHSIDELRLLIADEFNVQKKELRVINTLLKHLSDSVDKHDKFDWRGIAINVAFNIALHLALNPEQTRQLLQLFAGVFSKITYLLP